MPHPHAIPLKSFLLNTARIELWPAKLLSARSNADARALSRAHTVLRRKRDGRYLAAVMSQGVLPLQPRLVHEPGIEVALDALDALDTTRGFDIDAAGELPLDSLLERLDVLGLDEAYGDRTGLSLVAEPAALALAGFDRYRRPLWLTLASARAWNAMRRSATKDGITLEAISGRGIVRTDAGIRVAHAPRGGLRFRDELSARQCVRHHLRAMALVLRG
jgi:D-alanyl-D-alanine carboxypeptidase